MLTQAVVRHPLALPRTPGHGQATLKVRAPGKLTEIASSAVEVWKPRELGVQSHKRHLLADNPASG